MFAEVSYEKLCEVQEQSDGDAEFAYSLQLYHNRSEREKKYKTFYKKRKPDTKLFSCLGKYCTDKLYEEMKKHNDSLTRVAVSGGQMCGYLFGKEWNSDLDIFVSRNVAHNWFGRRYLSEKLLHKKRPNNILKLPPFLSDEFKHKTILYNELDPSIPYGKNPHILTVMNYISADGRKVQLIVLRNGIMPFDSMDNFDLLCCKVLYDGSDVYYHPDIDPSKTDIYQTFEKKPCRDLPCYDWFVKKYKQTILRIKKYQLRGFTFINPCNKIPDEFKTSFPETSFTNMKLTLGKYSFYIDGGFFARHSEMVAAMLSGNFSESIDNMACIDVSHMETMTPKILDDILRYFYRLTDMYINPGTFWPWLEFCEFFGISRLSQDVRNKSSLVLEGVIFPIHLEMAYKYRLKIYPKLICNFAKQFKDLSDIDALEKITDPIIKGHVIFYALTGKTNVFEKEKKAVLCRENGKIIHPETRLVFHSASDRRVCGMMKTDGKIIDLNDETRSLAEKWGFKLFESEDERVNGLESDSEYESESE